ncbi:class I SAM-dependent methyltransferase [Granulicella tundricola]|uniref:class I SAM-dependent methyltransferase n=1 Tax=Granulicella tundricola TaxID=940615 RepID=UPI0002FE3253|nr:class I SAM-dependent methyltransferase [Granulicella tundricola]
MTEFRNGIWCSLAPHLAADYERFVAEYEFIRNAEGRGSLDPTYYHALPYQDLSGKMTAQWKIRARTFDHLLQHILKPLADQRQQPLRILDLGAGNGWLSYRLSRLGHLPVAVDLLTNDRDGLSAGSNFSSQLPVMFPRVQASLDDMPFASETFDLAIFNASFHYSQDYRKTLAEALRCLRPSGTVVIADTPWYAKQESGVMMVEEKHMQFRAAYGFASNSLQSQEFLTPERLEDLARTHELTWQEFRPFYGIKWALRPLIARLKHRRTPSQFRIYTAKVPA